MGSARSDYWPTSESGIVLDAPHKNWNAIAGEINKGCRGLPGGAMLGKVVRRE